ncbi:Ger(x)C family spore germination protein [Evansella sp. AB-rgal1]|uniref:Ger(x)C family spore germination protein n=1 Tax=Evansella sp. AB-rgal1 TaxID=3242696 RepID=UPI00359DF67A
MIPKYYILKIHNILYIMLLMCFLFLVGCNDTREIDQRTIVIGMGIDKTDDDLYEVTLQVPILIGSGTHDANDVNNDFNTISGKGEYVWEAISNIEAKTPTVLFFGHLKAITIGETLAREGIDQIIDLLDRRAPLANEVFLLIVRHKNNVKDFLDNESPLVTLPALYIDRYFSADQKISRTRESRLYQYRRDTNMISGAAMIPLAYSDEESIYIEDLGIFKDQKLITELVNHEAGISTLLKDENVEHMNYSLSFPHDDHELRTSVRVNLKMDYKYDKSNPVEISMDIQGKGELIFLYPEKERASHDTVNVITKHLEKAITKDIEHTIKKMKKLNIEPWLLGHRMWAFDHNYFDTLDWDKSGWRNSIIDINVNIEIEQTGQRGMLDKRKIGK